MTDLKPLVAIVNNTNSENMSRHELLKWVNNTVNGQYKKVEELYSGVAYCQIMRILFPNCINLKRVKLNPKMEHEVLHNLKILQNALTSQKFDKTVPIERLLKKRFQDNFEFLQWFKKFYDINLRRHNVSPCAPATVTANKKQQQRKSINNANNSKTKLLIKKNTKENLQVGGQQNNAVSPTNLCTLKEITDQLRQKIKMTKKQRDFSFQKLLKIEDLLKQSIARNEYVDWGQRGLNMLYSTENKNNSKLENSVIELD